MPIKYLLLAILTLSIVHIGHTKENTQKSNHLSIMKNFSKNIRNQYIGQDSAIKSIRRTLINSAMNNPYNDARPEAFLFIGPPGVGKKYLAKLIGKMFDMPQVLFSMNTYTDEADINIFSGVPYGYIGGSEGQLIRWTKKNPTSSIIFDEIDKAHSQIIDQLIILMESGVARGRSGGPAGYTQKDGFMIFTSSVGQDLINSYDFITMG